VLPGLDLIATGWMGLEQAGFHATSAARWRRYVYLLPRRYREGPGAGGGAGGGQVRVRGDMARCPDVDAASINAFLQPLVAGGRLDYTAFARSNGRATGDASMCRLLRVRVGTGKKTRLFAPF
jgi:tRNA U38,U39,U40 pseudouridine synthase TruA